jgi:small subunit ribosomal protein S4
MAVSREPILKKCKHLGISPAVMGLSKDTKRGENQNRRQKVSEYGLQLKEKQKVKFIYGMLEKQFRHYFEIAEKMEGKTGENLLTLLESRLDNTVYRLGFAATRRQARQLVTHGHFKVDGKRVDIPSYRLKVGDDITVREKSENSQKFKEIAEFSKGKAVPQWLDKIGGNSAKVTRMPIKDDLDYEVAEHLIVELYSK